MRETVVRPSRCSSPVLAALTLGASLTGASLTGLSLAGCGDRSAEAAGGASVAAESAPAEPITIDTAALSALAPDSIYALGEAAYADQGFGEASAIWRLGLDRVRRDGDAPSEARYLTSLGLAAYNLGDYETAERLEREALAVEHEHALRAHMPRTYNALGLIAWQQGHFEDARSWYDSTFAAARAVDDVSYHTKALVNLASVETQLGEIETARERMHEGLAIFRDLGLADMEVRTLVNLAWLERDAGNPDVALDLALQARALAREHEEGIGEEAALGQLASLYLLAGRHQAALAVVDSALDHSRRHGLRQQEAANLEILAGLHRQIGDVTRALRLYDSAQAINGELGLLYEQGLTLYRMADIQAELGHRERTRTLAGRALDLHRETGATTAEIDALLVLAEVEELEGNETRADEHLDTAEDLAGELGLRSSRLDVGLTKARLADHRGEATEVIAVLDEIEEELLLAGFAAESEAASLRARALTSRGDLNAAEAAGRRAIELIDRARGELGFGRLGSILAHSRAGPYADLVDVLLRQDRGEEAYEVAAAVGAQGQRSAAGGWWSAGAAAPDTARERLLRRIGTLAAEIRALEQDYWDPALVAEPAERIREARREYEALVAAAPSDRAKGSAGPVSPATLAGIQSSLRSDEALVQFLVGDDRAFGFLVTVDGVRGTRLDATPQELATRIRLARRLVDDPSAGDPIPVLEALHAALLGPLHEAGRFEQATRLAVIPHGVLTYLPFAALRDPATGRWLAEGHIVRHLPDAASLLPSTGEARGGGSLEVSGSVLAPLPDRLPATRREAEAVAASLGNGTRVAIGDGATEAAMRKALLDRGVVHVASHAELNAADPFLSRIELADAVSPASEPSLDGRLEVRELLDLPIRSPLVFLSGCETGLGAGWSTAYAVGEDFATLERALLEAGAGNVVATLWRIEDESAAVFAAGFYEHLRASDAFDAAEALALAQREMIADPRFVHPFHWAAYRASGAGPR